MKRKLLRHSAIAVIVALIVAGLLVALRREGER